MREGEDVTVVTYGPMVRIALTAAELLGPLGVDVEVIDVQSLLPFDVNGVIVRSLQKTNRILLTDEDVPGGTTAYMMQQVLEEQNGFYWLDAAPRTLPAQPHRPAYGTDGDWSAQRDAAGSHLRDDARRRPGALPTILQVERGMSWQSKL